MQIACSRSKPRCVAFAAQRRFTQRLDNLYACRIGRGEDLF